MRTTTTDAGMPFAYRDALTFLGGLHGRSFSAWAGADHDHVEFVQFQLLYSLVRFKVLIFFEASVNCSMMCSLVIERNGTALS